MLNPIIMINNLSKNTVSDTVLNQTFKNFILNKNLPNDQYEIYDSLFNLFDNNNLYKEIKEIKYQVTDKGNINDVFINLINKNKDILPMEITSYLNILYDIENYNWIEQFS